MFGRGACEVENEKQGPSLFAWRSGARDQFEVKHDREAVAAGGDAQLRVLEFELISRIIASLQSMGGWR
jgi:hypothetical protein